jgi:hypothetical protein
MGSRLRLYQKTALQPLGENYPRTPVLSLSYASFQSILMIDPSYLTKNPGFLSRDGIFSYFVYAFTNTTRLLWLK